MGSDTLATAYLGAVDYSRALELQDGLVAARQSGAVGDTLLLLEHPPVYTLGRGASERYLLAPPAGIAVLRVSRGGQVTYHGPGQLVGYPIILLEGRTRDLHVYLRMLEQVLIGALADFGIAATRRDGLTGVWVGNRKIASIGVGVRRWVTLHGFALNVTADLAPFSHIVPCGIQNCEMTSIAREGNAGVEMALAAAAVARSFAAAFGYRGSRSADPADLWPLGCLQSGGADQV